MNTSQLIFNTTIPNDNLFDTPRNPKPRMPRTALVFPNVCSFKVNLVLRIDWCLKNALKKRERETETLYTCDFTIFFWYFDIYMN